MNRNYYPATLLCDFYKISHREQYPKNTKKIYATWTPRTSRIQGVNEVIFFGLQAFIKEYLIDYFNENFFNRDIEDVINEYERVLKYTLDKEIVDSEHIRSLHRLGYLPIRIKAVEEGIRIPIKTPMFTIENTVDEFFWVTNYLETLMSCMLWQPMTSATISNEYRKILDKYAIETTGTTDGVQFQGHDFSMRGMSSLESAKSSGAGHLLSFVGTDTIPSILYMEQFYNANLEKDLIGTSIPATEHSVQCAYGQEDEINTYKRLINDIYPNGLVSIVSDTWDLWKVLTEYIPQLKTDILKRDGKVVIRPDSGDPVKIICGDEESDNPNTRKGVIEILWDIFGGTITEQGYKVLDSHIGAIYGDAITLDRCREICEKLKEKGFASTNMVYGIGSFTYQYNTRDTFGFALKTTYSVVGNEERFLFKNPITDNGVKKSQRGKVAVINNGENIGYIDVLNWEQERDLANNMLETVFFNGRLIKEYSLNEIRSNVNN